MASEDIARKWFEQVDEDIETAETLFKTGHWLYIGFLCHQAVEKLVKGYWLACRDDEPIYLHNHFRLATLYRNHVAYVHRRSLS